MTFWQFWFLKKKIFARVESSEIHQSPKGGFKSEDTGKFLRLQHKYSISLSWAENLNKLFTVLGGKFKFSAQDSDLEYLFWRSKNSPVSSDLEPPLTDPRVEFFKIRI